MSALEEMQRANMERMFYNRNRESILMAENNEPIKINESLKNNIDTLELIEERQKVKKEKQK